MVTFVYFGSSDFARDILQGLLQEHVIPSIVVTQPDRPQGRGLTVLPTPVSELAASHNLAIMKPSSLKDEAVLKTLRALEPECFLVADYGKILPADLLAIPSIIPLAIHPSLLPRYRGPAPINWAILNGDTETGITLFAINEGVDCGPLLLQERFTIAADDDALTLKQKLAAASIAPTIRSMQLLEKGNVSLTSQDEALVTFAPKLKKEDGRITWKKSAVEIVNSVRGLAGWPGAYTTFNDCSLRIESACVVASYGDSVPGTIARCERGGITVSAGSGAVLITRLKPAGKKAMDAWAFVCGYHLQVGVTFT